MAVLGGGADWAVAQGPAPKGGPLAKCTKKKSEEKLGPQCVKQSSQILIIKVQLVYLKTCVVLKGI